MLQDVERTIANGIPRTSMSGYRKWLSAEEIRRVAEYTMDFSKASGVPDGAGQSVSVPGDLDAATPTASAVSTASPTSLNRSALTERLARGKKAYTKNCAVCHGNDGRGLGELAGQMRDTNGFLTNPVDLTDALGYGGGSNPSDIYRTLTTGIAGSPMPRFDAVLDDETRGDVAVYVASLQVAPAERTLVSREAWNKALPSRERGEYMTRAMSCALCHNAYDKSGEYYSEPYMAGGVAITIPGLGVFPTRNITSHPEDGLADWTEAQIARTITTGYAPDRRIEAFSMPWVYFSHLTDEDSKDIAAYVKKLTPIQNKVPMRVYEPIWKRIWGRLRQLVGLELGRLEYPPLSVGDRFMQTKGKSAGSEQRDE
jgi:mono/diheme cytochrome c family protein